VKAIQISAQEARNKLFQRMISGKTNSRINNRRLDSKLSVLYKGLLAVCSYPRGQRMEKVLEQELVQRNTIG
jgi:hypothetical protein